MGKFTRKTNRGTSDKIKILEAVKKILFSKAPLRTVAKDYDIPRNSLRRYAEECSKIPNFENLSSTDMLQHVSYISSYHGPQVSNFTVKQMHSTCKSAHN